MPLCKVCEDDKNMTYVEQHICDDNGKIFFGQCLPQTGKPIKGNADHLIKKTFKDICSSCLDKQYNKYVASRGQL
jgi:hypothetical protein